MQFEIYNRSEFPKPFLAIDEDNTLIRLASPRTSSLPNLKSRIRTLIKHLKPGSGVALTIEELCPGGLDLTDGLLIAKAFEKSGAKFIIISSGTIDFPSLKNRKMTKLSIKKMNYIWLASACFLVGRIFIPIYAQGNFDLPIKRSLLRRAKACGLSGLIRFDSNSP